MLLLFSGVQVLIYSDALVAAVGTPSHVPYATAVLATILQVVGGLVLLILW